MRQRLRWIAVAAAAVLVVGGVVLYLAQNLPRPGPGPNGGLPATHTASPSTSSPVAGGKGCGVSRTGDGYAFSWLHVSRGYLVDEKNCIVNLRGFNWSQLEFGNAVGGGPKTRISEGGIAWFSQNFNMNVWRIAVNTTWWNENVDIPLAGMKYQDWIRQVVGWAEKYGNYVILTKGPQFQAPPCGGGVTHCPSQNEGQSEVASGVASPQVQTTGAYIDPAITMWDTIAKLYANDPAVLYDSWNEMHDLDPQVWHNNSNALITAIRTQNPRSIIFLGGPNFKGNINALVEGSVPDFTQQNLVYDFHVYDGFEGVYNGKKCSSPLSYIWKNWPTGAYEQVSFSQQRGKAVAFSEWGGCNNLTAYSQAITAFARDHHICLAYYDETNVAVQTKGVYSMNENGKKVQEAYATF